MHAKTTHLRCAYSTRRWRPDELRLDV